MMINERTDTPDRVPWVDLDIPVAWITPHPSPDPSAPNGLPLSAATVSAVNAAIAMIPSQIRNMLRGEVTVPYNTFTGQNYRRGAIRAFLAQAYPGFSDTTYMTAQFPSAANAYHAPTVSDSKSPVAFHAGLDPASTFFPPTIVFVHEYGHHIDYCYSRIYEAITENRTLTNQVGRMPFYDLFAAAYPTMPSDLYGHTNILEWFAECWTAQIIPLNTNYRRSDQATHFYELSGQSESRARSVRAAFTAILPMPAFAAGRFD